MALPLHCRKDEALKKTTPAKLKPFVFHGLDLDWEGEQAEGACPLCDKDGHFFINKSTGQWDCKSCGETGNIYGFLSRLLEMSIKSTTDKDFEELTDDRGIEPDVLKAWQVARNPLNGDWLIPAYNNKGKLANLYKWGFDNPRAMSTPGLKIWPFGLHLLKKGQKVVWLQEGPWDGMSVWGALQQTRDNGQRLVKTRNPKKSLGAKEAVIATPGANTFKAEWVPLLAGKTVRLAYDNDWPRKTPSGKSVRPGWDGMKRVGKVCGEANGEGPKGLERLYWGKRGHSKDFEDGYDVRDLFGERGPQKGLAFLLSKMKKVSSVLTGKKLSSPEDEGPVIEPIPRSSFRELCKDFEQTLHWTPILQDTLATMLAVMASTELPGEQLWLRVIGPPGSGKTTLAECLSPARDYVYPVSSITGLHSGFTEGRSAKARAEDNSLVPKMDRKTTIIKDGDTLLNAPNRDKILAELRDLYDGTSRASYRNKVAHDYESLRMTFVLCATDEIRNLNRTHLGERFLDCEILGEEDQTPFLQAAFNNTANQILSFLEDNQTTNKMLTLKQASFGFVNHLKGELIQSARITVPEKVDHKIQALGQTVSFCRAQVKRDKSEIAYRPRVELATRLTAQFTKLAICLAIVLGKSKVDADCLRIVRKIGLDTGYGFQFEIIRLLMKYKDGLSCGQIATALGLGKSSIERYTADMRELSILERKEVPNKSGVRGRNLHLFVLKPNVRKLWLGAGLKAR